MLGRVIIIIVGGGFAVYCVVAAVLTIFGKNPATLHLTKFLLVGYAAINAVLTPFGISGVIGGISRKKTLIRAFITFQWWLATFILIGLNVFNVIISRRTKEDFILRCQNNLAKSQPEFNFSARCTALANDAERATLIAACAQGGIMLFLGIVLLIVGQHEYNNISLEEETKNLLAKANFNEKVETDELGHLSPKTSNFSDVSVSRNISRNVSNVGVFVPDPYDDSGRYVTNVKRQPSKAATVNVDLARRTTNAGLRRNLTDPTGRNQTDPNFVTPYKGLARNPAGNIPNIPNIPPKRLARYPTNATDRSTNSANRVNVTLSPAIGNVYAPRNYVGTSQTSQATYPIAPPQRSLSTKQYINPPPPSYATQIVMPPLPISEVNEYNNYSNDYNNNNYNNYKPKPKPYTQTMAPHLTRM